MSVRILTAAELLEIVLEDLIGKTHCMSIVLAQFSFFVGKLLSNVLEKPANMQMLAVVPDVDMSPDNRELLLLN